MLAPCFRFGLWRWRYFAKLFGVVWFHGFCCCFCCRIRHLWKSCWSRHRVMFEGSERPRAGSSTCNHSLNATAYRACRCTVKDISSQMLRKFAREFFVVQEAQKHSWESSDVETQLHFTSLFCSLVSDDAICYDECMTCAAARSLNCSIPRDACEHAGVVKPSRWAAGAEEISRLAEPGI